MNISSNIVNEAKTARDGNAWLSAKADVLQYCVLSVAIDIGTTNISAVVYDIENKSLVKSYTVAHNSYVFGDIRSEQSVAVILDTAEKLLYQILQAFSGIVSIGLTGQMHGIVYIYSNGNPLSDLINWQDKRADEVLTDGKTTCERIFEITGEKIATGYGLATHYYNICNGLVPQGAVGFCSIMDLFAMKICGLKSAVTHTSVAASFGLFDVLNKVFMKEKLELLGIDESFLPAVTDKSSVIGECKGIPVSVAIEDNQAAFLGSVANNEESVLVNIGTGSQISAVSEYRTVNAELELRPFIEGKYLICGSAFCGGAAYSMLEEFFRAYTVAAGMEEASQYAVLNKLAAEAYERGDSGLDVDVSFFGKRSDPNLRGSIKMIDRQNFTPAELVLGVLKGMCDELYTLYATFEEKKKYIVASGGAVKKNEILQKLIADRFGMTVSVNTVDEEAAVGAAFFSAFAVDKIKYDNGFSEYIK